MASEPVLKARPVPQLPRQLENLVRVFDNVNTRTGDIFCWLLIPFALIVTMDVVMRYIFNAPTVWAWDVSRQLLGAVSVTGGGYALLYGAHVSIDVLTQKFSQRAAVILSLVTYILSLAALLVMFVYLVNGTWTSIAILERLPTFFSPPIYPLKVLITISIALFILEAVAQIIRIWFTLFSLPKVTK